MLSRLVVSLCCLSASSLVVAGDQLPGRGADAADRADVAQHADVAQDTAWQVEVPAREWEFVVIHHSATDSGSVESIHREHRSRRDRNGQPWLGIGYHFVIGNGSGMSDGEISATFRWREQLHGAHCGSLRHNGRGIGICLIGNFEEDKPTEAQIASVSRLLGALTDRYSIPGSRVLGHDQVRATACPGRWFPLREIVETSVRGELTEARADSWSSCDCRRR